MVVLVAVGVYISSCLVVDVYAIVIIPIAAAVIFIIVICFNYSSIVTVPPHQHKNIGLR